MNETSDSDAPSLLALPTELILHVLTFLRPFDLASVSETCRTLHTQSADDHIWQPIVNSNISTPITSPRPCASFRELYLAHHPNWFLLRDRIWYADTEPSGKLLITRYDAQKGCIVGHQVVANRGQHTVNSWDQDPQVIIHSFDPQVSLERDQAVLKLAVDSHKTEDTGNNFPSERGYAPVSEHSKETLMDTFAQPGLYASFLLSRALPESAIGEGTAVWPPNRIPAYDRTRNATRDAYRSLGHRPSKLSEISQYTFRLRKWVEYTGRRTSPSMMTFSQIRGLDEHIAMGTIGNFLDSQRLFNNAGMSVRMPEDITTYAALPKYCYTPTKQKPWRGIWCGDYSGHGCEFLVLLQPDKADEQALPEGMNYLRTWFNGARRSSGSSGSSYSSAVEDMGDDAGPVFTQGPLPSMTEGDNEHASSGQAAADNGEEDVYSGRIEAIKLTGDPNVPRGEYTFIAPNIGETLRIADEDVFRGARVVKSAGHIAARGFREGMCFLAPCSRGSTVADTCIRRPIHPIPTHHDLA